MATGYRDLLTTRHVARLLAGTLLGRLPNATASLLVLLFLRSEGLGYSAAGALAAAYGLATAVGQPLLGRLVDRHGQPRVLLPAGVVSTAAMAALAPVGADPLAAAAVLVVVAGLATPPLEGALRALWPGVLPGADRVQRAYALDAVAQEVMFTTGPLAVLLVIALWSEAGALLAINAVGLLGTVWVVVSPPSRRWRGAPREAHWLGALRSPGLLALLGCFFFVGAALGAQAVAAVAYGDEHGDGRAAAYLMSAVGGGALAGGLAYGARSWPGVPERRLLVLVAALTAGQLPLVAAPASVPLATGLAALAGLALAPSLACAFVVIDRHAPRGTVTEAFSWLVTTFGVGAAVGTAAAGPAVERGEGAAGFAVAAACAVLALLTLLATGRALALPEGVPVRAAGGRNDRNAASEPGFRTGHQA